MSGSLDIAPSPAALRDLLGEIGDLKRVRSAGREGSIAQRGFRQAWHDLVAGGSLARVMRQTVAAALAAARLGDLDGPKLLDLGLDREAALAVLQRGFDDVGHSLDGSLAADLRAALRVDGGVGAARAPAFVDDLASQPRAGVTCPGRPRQIFEPPEDHAEHCWAVAVFGVLLSPSYGADPVTVFLAGLAHHLHNARMPDSGLTGEMLLGGHLDGVCRFASSMALAQLDRPLLDEIVRARKILPDATTPEGRAFHAADVVDRVMQIAQHLRAASTTMPDVLGDMGLVHDGPVKPFHDRVLAEMGLP